MILRIAAALAVCGAALAQTPVINGDPLGCFILSGPPTASSTRIAVEGPGFTEALRVRSHASANAWDIRLQCRNVAPVHANDTLLASFWVRNVQSASGLGLVTFVVEHLAPPYTKHAFWTAAARSDWQRVQVPFTMPQDYPDPISGPDKYELAFWVTFEPQEIELGGISVVNFGPGKSLSELGYTWAGREADAPWRKEAAARIERIRKSDIVVAVKDGQGQPIANAPVRVRMKRHAFGFGAAVAADTLRNNERYRQEVLNNFNKVVIENHLKWPFFETWGRNDADWALDWLKQNGIAMVRGHNVIWPGRGNLPFDVQAMLAAANAAALRARINSHIAEVMAFTKGRVSEWDVLNEPYTNKDVQAVLGDGEMAEWFKLAREADPAVKLYINDYDIIEDGGWSLAHLNGYHDIIRRILEQGGPIDGIGLQGHFNMNVTPPPRLLEVLDRFAEFGKDLQVTEYDLNIADEQLQAEYFRDFLTACFSHPAMTGFLMWGFWEGAHWLPRGAMLRRDWSAKPSYQVWRDLVYRDWWTDAEGATGADGVYAVRGFLGDYDVEVGGLTLPLTVAADQPNSVHVTTGRIIAVTNAASFRTGAIAPGEIIEIWGEGYGPSAITYAAYDDGFARSAGNVRVLFDGVPAPLIHAWNGRVAAIVPYLVSGSTRIQVEYQGIASREIQVQVSDTAPGLFTDNQGGTGPAAAAMLQEDGAWVRLGAGRKAKRGAYVALYVTGDGRMQPEAADGKAPAAPYPRPVQPVKVRFGGVESNCEYNWAGLVYAGVTQINACVPLNAPTGAVTVEVTAGGVPAQTGVTLEIE